MGGFLGGWSMQEAVEHVAEGRDSNATLRVQIPALDLITYMTVGKVCFLFQKSFYPSTSSSLK